MVSSMIGANGIALFTPEAQVKEGESVSVQIIGPIAQGEEPNA